MTNNKQQKHGQAGLTIRAFVVCLVALLLMGIWIEYEELYNTYGGPLAENSPPNSAIGIICALLVVSGILYGFRKSLRLVTAELVVIYSALVLAAPLMTQGLWHRFFGLVSAIPHYGDFKSYESLPPMLWPHGKNLVENNRFEKGLEGFKLAGNGAIKWVEVDWKNKRWKLPSITTEDTGRSLGLPAPAETRRREGEIAAKGQQKTQSSDAPLAFNQSCSDAPNVRGVDLHSPDGDIRRYNTESSTNITVENMGRQSRSQDSSCCSSATLLAEQDTPPATECRICKKKTCEESSGKVAIAVAIARYDKTGREVLIPGENFLVSALVKTEGFAGDSLYSISMQADDGPITPLLVNSETTKPTFALPGGLRRIGVNPVAIPANLKTNLTLYFSLNGQGTLTLQDIQFINVEAVEGVYSGMKGRADGPALLRQWAWPAVSWSLLIGGLFLGFMGLNVLMRKQWVENERFTFPLTIVPKHLFAEQDGKLAILHNKAFQIGFACALPLVIWKGLKFYCPSLPGLSGDPISFAGYVTSPLLKAYLTNVGIGITTGLGLSLSVMAIAFLIETDILFTLWATFLVFQLWNLFGKAFSFTSIPGYPWEFQQAMGAFIAYAVLALFVARHHLRKVVRSIFGRERLPEESQEMVSYRTAFLMIVGSLAAIVFWSVWTKMGATAGLLFFGYMLLCGFAASKIRAEMGAPWGYLTPYLGMQFVAAMGGFAVFKSTGMLLATIASGFMCTACFLLIAPAQIEMMELGRHFNVKPRHVGAGLALGLLGGLFIGGFVVLCWAYGLGANNMKTTWPYEQNWQFDTFRVGELNADHAMAASAMGKAPETQALNFARNPDAKGLGIGAVVTIALAALRAHFTWFPFHPLGYVLASSYFMKTCWFYFFVAWLLRLVLFRIGGAQTIRRGLVPFCIGMFLACVASIVIYDIVGIILRMQGITEIYCKIP